MLVRLPNHNGITNTHPELIPGHQGAANLMLVRLPKHNGVTTAHGIRGREHFISISSARTGTCYNMQSTTSYLQITYKTRPTRCILCNVKTMKTSNKSNRLLKLTTQKLNAKKVRIGIELVRKSDSQGSTAENQAQKTQNRSLSLYHPGW